MGSNEQAILRTLSYSSIFHFPLREDELFYYLIAANTVSPSSFQAALRKLSSMLVENGGLFALPEEKGSILKRQEMEKMGKAKRRMAQRLAAVLSYIPTIYFIGISGSVGVGQTEEDDDIDLFVIAKKNTLFVTRLAILVLLSLVGKRRRRQAATAKDLFCVNMILDASSLQMLKERQDLYTAHEIAQLYPLFERNNMYHTFLHANTWVQSFLPHTSDGRAVTFVQGRTQPLEVLFPSIEPLARWLQLLLIKRHKTRETVRHDLVAFHPTDYRSTVLTAYKRQVQLYEKYYNTVIATRK
jgi:hypothetical protein